MADPNRFCSACGQLVVHAVGPDEVPLVLDPRVPVYALLDVAGTKHAARMPADVFMCLHEPCCEWRKCRSLSEHSQALEPFEPDPVRDPRGEEDDT